MSPYVVVVERVDRFHWRYGKAEAAGHLDDTASVLRHDPETGEGEPVGPTGPDHSTALLLVRGCDSAVDRIIYDLGALMFQADGRRREPPTPGLRWSRATAGKAKAPGETLIDRAARQRQRPVSAA